MSTNVQTFPGDVEIGGSVSGDGSGITQLNADNITTGTLNSERVPVLDASKINSGQLDYTRVPPTPFLKGVNGGLNNYDMGTEQDIDTSTNYYPGNLPATDHAYGTTWTIPADGVYYIKLYLNNTFAFSPNPYNAYYPFYPTCNILAKVNNTQFFQITAFPQGTAEDEGYFTLYKDQTLKFVVHIPTSSISVTDKLNAGDFKFLLYKI